MKIKIKKRKNFFTGRSLAILAALSAFVLVGGMILYNHIQNGSKDLTETPQLIQKLEANGERKEALVFFKVGCPYCRAGKSTIEAETKKANFPVYFVNTQSEVGKMLVANFNVNHASTITIIEKQKYKNFPYAEKVNGKIVPLIPKIKAVLRGEQ